MKQKYLAFLETKHAAVKLLETNKTKRTKIIVLNKEIEPLLEAKNIAFKKIESYELPEAALGEQEVEWIKKLGKLKLTKNDNFKTAFTSEKCSLWFLLEPWLGSDCQILYTRVIDTFYKISAIKTISEQEKKILLIIDDKSETSYFTRQLNAKKRIIKCAYNQRKQIKRKATAWMVKKYGRWILRKSVSLGERKKRKRKGKVVIGFSSHIRKIVEGKKLIKKEFHEIIREKLGDQYEMLVIETPVGLQLKKPKVPKSKTNYLLMENYLTFKGLAKARKTHEKIKKDWKKTKKKIIQKHAIYQGVSFYHPLLENLNFFFKQYLLSLLVEMEIYREIMKREKPKVAILFYNHSLIGREILFAAKENNVKSVGIPHGSEGHVVALVNDKEDMDKNNNGVRIGKCPLVNIMCAGGKKEKEKYEQLGKYKPEWIAETGRARYDIIPQVEKVYSKAKTLKALGLENKKSIMYASQYLPERLFKESLEKAAKSLQGTEYQVIVKLHPMENEGYEHHKKIFEKYGVKATYLKDIPILELLNAVDLVISGFSTVDLEGAALETPFILIDIYKEDHKKILGSEKILIPKTVKDMKIAIRRLLEDTEYRKEYLLEMKKVAELQLGKTDGKSAERIAKVIQKLV